MVSLYCILKDYCSKNQSIFFVNFWFSLTLHLMILIIYVGLPGNKKAKVADVSKFGRAVSGCFHLK